MSHRSTLNHACERGARPGAAVVMTVRSSCRAWVRAPVSEGASVSRAGRTGTWRGSRANAAVTASRTAVTDIPDVRAGDSVRWHCDMVHGVAPVTDQKGWGNVMYILAAPWCPRNEVYAATVRDALRTGSSPGDFPAEHYERIWPDRCTTDDLDDIGRRGLGLAG